MENIEYSIYKNVFKEGIGAALNNCKTKSEVNILRDMGIRRCNDDEEFNQMIPERLR